MAPNFAHRNLQNYSFQGQDLTGVNFSYADLRGCHFTATVLVGANFQGVRTGQSDRQTRRLIGVAIAGPLVFLGFSFWVAQASAWLLNDQAQKILFGALPLLALVGELFLRDSIVRKFPRFAADCALAALAGLFAVMGSLTLGLAVVGLAGGGLWLLLLMAATAAVTWRIFQWLVQAIHSEPGTCFCQANLTNADFSDARVQNTDFSRAILTGACVFGWSLNRHTQFTDTDCEYLYLGSHYQQRQPLEGALLPGELDRIMAQFKIG